MQMVSKLKFLSIENKTSKKGNNYLVLTAIQGSDVLSVMLGEKAEVPDLKFGDEFVAILDFNPKYKSMKFLGVQ